MEKKIFSVGVRIEHLQERINFAQYSGADFSLPAADYKLSVPTSCGKTLYTLCMCPGGVVVPTASENDGVVVNGMSYFDRNGTNANSALLLNVLPEELGEDLFSGFAYQKELERKAFLAGGGGHFAPIQLVGDFLKNESGSSFGSREGLVKMGGLIPGFDAEDAVLTGVESRATCPVRILRGDDYQSSLPGLYPIGEGAGYAGGIMSSAMDGMKAAEAYLKDLEEVK